MFLEDLSYFVGSINVPHKTAYPNSTRVGNATGLQKAVDDHEKSLMMFALGNPLYDEFLALFNVDGTLIAPTPVTKWTKFINGETYTVDSESYKWRGLRYTEGSVKKSLIADYVFCKFSEDNIVHLGGAGFQTTEAKNAEVHNAIPTITNIWNEFISKYQGDNLTNSGPRYYESRYGTIAGIDHVSSDRDYFVSMYQYLLDHPIDFPNFKTKIFDLENSFGI